jgi:hypothetical protein
VSLVAGKVGIWSKVSKKFVFGIAENTAAEAKRKLRERLGYDSLKYRFVVKPISKLEVPNDGE